jgi:hypothetical protein
MSIDDLGDKAEALVEAQVSASGWRYIADRQFRDGRAPMIQGEDDDNIRPDFSVSKAGDSVWIEVKGKTDSCPHNGVERHGIDLPNWQHYTRVASHTGMPCWLFVYEQSTGTLLCADLADLSVADKRIKDEYPPDDPYGGPMVFFNRRDFHPKPIDRAEYPEQFFGQGKLPLENVSDDSEVPLFPNSDLGDQSDTSNHRLGDFATDGGTQ